MNKTSVEVTIVHEKPTGRSSVAVDQTLMKLLHARNDFLYGSQGRSGGLWKSDIASECSKTGLSYEISILKFEVPFTRSARFDPNHGLQGVHLFDYKHAKADFRNAFWERLGEIVDRHHSKAEQEALHPFAKRTDETFRHFVLTFGQHLPEWFEQTDLMLAVVPMRNAYGRWSPTAMVPKRYVNALLVEVANQIHNDRRYHLTNATRDRIVLSPPPRMRPIYTILGRPGTNVRRTDRAAGDDSHPSL